MWAQAALTAMYWNNVQPGTYTMTAQAVDSNGVTGISTPVTVTVNAAQAPAINPEASTTGTATLTSPASNSSYTVPANILLTAAASESGATIARD